MHVAEVHVAVMHVSLSHFIELSIILVCVSQRGDTAESSKWKEPKSHERLPEKFCCTIKVKCPDLIRKILIPQLKVAFYAKGTTGLNRDGTDVKSRVATKKCFPVLYYSED